MTIRTHFYLDGKLAINRIMGHCPRVGDIVRFGDNKYAIVTEVVWCMDENQSQYDRVNIRTVSEEIL